MLPRLAYAPRLLAVLGLAALTCACSHNSQMAEVAGPEAQVAAQSVPSSESIAAEAAVVPAAVKPEAPMPGFARPLGGEARHMSPQAVADTDAPYLLDSGDKVRIFVYGQPNLSRIYTVDGGGFISMPLIGAVKSRGETTFDLERAITAQLGAKYVKDPKVSVEIATHRPFFILGEVRSAGQYPYVSGMTVQTAVAIAGGYSERANERAVLITRRVNGAVEKMKVPGDSVVLPGDTIYVRERFF